MNISTTYRLTAPVLSFVILLGMVLPAGLNAKRLVDFCMTEMNHHEMTDSDSSHGCDMADGADHSATQKNHHECEGTQICACAVDKAPLRDQTLAPSSNSFTVILPQTEFNFSVISPDEIIYKDLTPGINQHSPPLYLLYDTFLN